MRIWMLICWLLVAGCGGPAVPKASTDSSGESQTPPSAMQSSLGSTKHSDSQAASQPETKGWFEDFTEQSGIRFQYDSGRDGRQFTILESVGGGVALLDFDLDGDLDLFFPGGGTISAGEPLAIKGKPSFLFRNDGKARFTDVSELVAAPPVTFYSHGTSAADFDRDGDPDVLITGFRHCALLRNEAGKRFSDITQESGLSLSDWSTAAAWADINRDGWPDLFVVNYVNWDPQTDESCGDPARKIRDVCPPSKYLPARQQIFLNKRNGTFAEVTSALEGSAKGKGMGIVATDLNADGFLDFYVANDETANQLYLGGPDFPLKEVGVLSATAGNEFGIPEGSMGVDAGDFDGDGLPDLWVVNFQLEDNSLYRNQGNNLFVHATVAAGLGGATRPQVKFGTGFADFDLDGWLDLFVINGHVLYETGLSSYLQQPFLFRNEGDENGRRFRDITREHGGAWFQGTYAGRGAAVGDLDNDGDLDLVVVRQDEPASILLNRLQPANWLRLELRGTSSEPAAAGAVITYRYQNRSIVRHVRAGAGYLSQFDQRILLPVDDPAYKGSTDGNAMQLEVIVQWLTGKRERFQNLRPRQTNLIQEGRGDPQ